VVGSDDKKTDIGEIELRNQPVTQYRISRAFASASRRWKHSGLGSDTRNERALLLWDYRWERRSLTRDV